MEHALLFGGPAHLGPSARGREGWFLVAGRGEFCDSGIISALAFELTHSGTGQIETSIFARPLSVRLYLDTDETIKKFTCVYLVSRVRHQNLSLLVCHCTATYS